LFTPTSVGLAFTPGGLRLASRATEMLGLQYRTIREVSQAGRGRRLLRIAATSLFAEYAAPGLIELFASRADDLDVELSVHDAHEFGGLLATRAVDVAIGPVPEGLPELAGRHPFLNYQIAVVAGPRHPLARVQSSAAQLREQIWLLGPSAAGDDAVVRAMLHRFEVPEERQRIFQSHAAALEETRHDNGVALALSFAIADDVANGRLVRLSGHGVLGDGVWATMTLADHSLPPAAAELTRFMTTPRATQAMLRGSGINVGRFRPSVHVTLWS
jgi:DNA-binding transcriptional LysR family regulator